MINFLRHLSGKGCGIHATLATRNTNSSIQLLSCDTMTPHFSMKSLPQEGTFHSLKKCRASFRKYATETILKMSGQVQYKPLYINFKMKTTI